MVEINLKLGQPPNDLLFPENFLESVNHAFSLLKTSKKEDDYLYRLLNYGQHQGDVRVREELSKFLTNDLMYTVDKDNLMITNGVSHGVDLLCQALLKPSETILLEAPTYFLFIDLFKQRNLKVETIHRKEDGSIDL